MVFLPIGRGIRTLISEDIYRSVHQRLKKASVRGPDYLQDVIESISTFYKLSERKVRHILANPEYTPFIDLPELYKRIGNDVMIVKKEDALDLPPKLYTTLKVQLKPKAAKMYKSFVDMNFVDNLAIKKGLPLFYSLQDLCNGYYPTLTDPEDPESEKLLVPQEENPKIDMLLEKISEIDLSREQVVVWSNRKLFLQDIKKSLDAEEINSCTYDGDTPTDERERIRKEFQEGKIRVFIGNQKSGAFGLDFLKAANYVFFMSNDYSVETREQAEDRVHRGGIISAKNIFDVVVEGSVDERVTKSLLLGKELIHSGAMHRSVFDLKEVIF
jgi:SNF2 family DNA or RNA helicase